MLILVSSTSSAGCGALMADATAIGALLQQAAQHLAKGEARAAEAPLRAALANAAAAARAATAIDEAALRPMLVTLVEAVARTVLMAELAGGRRVLAPLVEAALAEVGEGALPTLLANPETLALLGPELPPGLSTAPDATLPPAHIVLAAPDYRIEAGIEERLARIVKALASLVGFRKASNRVIDRVVPSAFRISTFSPTMVWPTR